MTSQKKATLQKIYTAQKWLTDLQASMALPLEYKRQNLMLQYKKLMGEFHGSWPSGGPTLWLAKWEELINKAERYDEPLRTWLRDVCLVWEQVSDLTVYFSQVQISLERGDTAQYTPAEISSQIHRRWEHRKQGLALRVINKPKATRSAFNAVDVTFDGEEPPEAEDARQAAPKKGKQKKKTKSERRNNRQDRSRSRSPASKDRTTANRTVKKHYGPCQACGGLSHSFKRCYLVLGREREWISEEARETFRNNMKVPSFKEEVDKVRSGNTNE